MPTTSNRGVSLYYETFGRDCPKDCVTGVI
jgi:hypothetical protein